ncbi:MAG TPA: helix-turn-helix transcriptional regulator [Mucilaginibacter sp.]|jgi:transcriptional regulator with XRE-family HTH domain|nr:helix-turn-helix transcriptional regulator [Mucilaginibacter sp.]
MDIRKKIGSRIKEYRTDLKLTQQKLAFKAQIDNTYINEVENGKRNVSVINLEKIITALGTDIRSFFDAPVFSSEVSKNV